MTIKTKKTKALKGIREINGKFKVEVMVNGERGSGTAASLEEAVALRIRLKNGLELGPLRAEDPQGEKPWTLEEAVERTFQLHWRDTKDVDRQRIRTRHLLNFFGKNQPIDTITAEKIVAFREWAERTLGNSQNTINKKVMALSRVLRTAYDLGKLKRMPKLYVARVKAHRIRFMTAGEEKLTLEAFKRLTSPDHVDAFQVLLDTGFRLGELWTISAGNINFQTNTITLWDGDTKNGLARTVPMTGRVRAILERRCASCKKGPLWPGRNNNWFQHQWNKVRTALGKDDDPDWVTHMLRHTCCSRLVQGGVRLFLVQQWMGHKSLAITQRYAHFAPEHLIDAGAILEQFTKEAMK